MQKCRINIGKNYQIKLLEPLQASKKIFINPKKTMFVGQENRIDKLEIVTKTLLQLEELTQDEAMYQIIRTLKVVESEVKKKTERGYISLFQMSN